MENKKTFNGLETKHFRRSFTYQDLYFVLYSAFRSSQHMIRSRWTKEINPAFMERIMLSVTEVNGCELCSYAHAKMALEKGLSQNEIQALLSGDLQDLPVEEAPAILFAQHYADTKGKPSKDSWNQIIELYGKQKAYGILGVIRGIMLGNVYGIPLSAIIRRTRKMKVLNSNLGHEIGMIASLPLFFPVAFIASIYSSIVRKPII